MRMCLQEESYNSQVDIIPTAIVFAASVGRVVVVVVDVALVT